jgi:hypothetical protein
MEAYYHANIRIVTEIVADLANLRPMNSCG